MKSIRSDHIKAALLNGWFQLAVAIISGCFLLLSTCQRQPEPKSPDKLKRVRLHLGRVTKAAFDENNKRIRYATAFDDKHEIVEISFYESLAFHPGEYRLYNAIDAAEYFPSIVYLLNELNRSFGSAKISCRFEFRGFADGAGHGKQIGIYHGPSIPYQVIRINDDQRSVHFEEGSPILNSELAFLRAYFAADDFSSYLVQQRAMLDRNGIRMAGVFELSGREEPVVGQEYRAVLVRLKFSREQLLLAEPYFLD